MADNLVKQRGGNRSTVTAESNKILPMLKGEVAVELSTLRKAHQKIEHNLQRLYSLDSAIVDKMDATQLDAEVTATESYNDKVLTILATINETLTSQIAAASTSQTAAPSGGVPAMVPPPSANMRLPKFEMATYEGDPMGWQPFWDVYNAVIHENSSMKAIQKFTYLLGYLEGDALAVAKNYSLTDANYLHVIEQLKERFGNKQRAQFAHFQAMMALEPAKGKSLQEVRRISDECELHIRSLSALGVAEDTFSIVFSSIIMSKLPEYLTTKICEKTGTGDFSLKDIREWIKADVRAREMGESSFNAVKNGQKPQPRKDAQPYKTTTTTSSLPAPGGSGFGRTQNTGNTRRPYCVFCSQTTHRSQKCRNCPTVDERAERLKELRACFNCLEIGHCSSDCGDKNRPCSGCSRTGHHVSLCRKRDDTPHQTTKKPWSKDGQQKKYGSTGENAGSSEYKRTTPKKTTSAVCVAQEHMNEEVDVAFLQTALATLQDESGKSTMQGRLLMDTASSRTYIREDCCDQLKLEVVGRTHITVGRFGTQKRITRTADQVRLNVVCKDGSIQPVLATVTPVICCPVARAPIDPEAYPVVKSITLAEPLNKVPDSLEIDLLIGSDQYYNFQSKGNPITCGDSLVFVNSRLGYLTSGVMPVVSKGHGAPESTLVLLTPEAEQLHVLHTGELDIERFWNIEDVGAKECKKAKITDEQALQQFQETVKFDDGRYHVMWPWKSKEPDLPNNFGLAYGRLRSTLTRLRKDEKLLSEYDKIIKTQCEKGIIERAPEKPEGKINYLPHQPELKPQSATTKIRVVYDASAKVKKDLPSLNDCLYRGPVILDDLCGLLMRFRLNKVALVSDIEKAFLQVRLQSTERDVTRFLWVNDVTKPPTGSNLVNWRFTSVFFGAISSPFLLGATVHTHLRRSDGRVAKLIRENLYVDNVITGEDNDQDAIKHYREAKRLFLGASMNLREFFTNSSVVRQSIAPEDRGKSTEPKVLGIKWDVEKDSLRCAGLKTEDPDVLTKRQITKQVAQIYDPCGWFAPVVVTGKLLVQEQWKLNLAWDEPVPDEISAKWNNIRPELSKIADLSIPRHIGDSQTAKLELHAFCDASSLATGVSVYLRRDRGDSVESDLLFAKTRLAPLKPQQTTPRLELIALVMGVNMVDFVDTQLHLPISAKFVWSDNQCVLYWLTKEKLGTKFVENMVNEIKKKEGITFRYVPSAENPADLPSRGCSAEELQKNGLWWHGPEWLLQSSETWPKDRTSTHQANNQSEQCICSISGVSDEDVEAQLVVAEATRPTAIVNPQNFSSFQRLLRTTAYVNRFVENVRKQISERETGTLTVHELSAARNYWEKLAQAQGFPELQQELTPQASKRSTLAQLNVFRDANGLLRCGGRLENAELPYDCRHPVLMPKNHPVTKLVIRAAHLLSGHSGVAQTLNDVRQRHWVVHGRSEVKRVIRSCQRCRRIDGGPYKIPKAPALPEFRVSEQSPFASTGLDYLGYLNVKVSAQATQKVWVCLFTCAASRAIHLELVENQSAEEFHLALRRFFAQYGCPRLIVSDNASQFVAVESAMKKLWKQVTNSVEIENFMVTQNIEWKKIPEAAPWMGGFYERLVGIVKKCLKKLLDGVCLNIGELRTVLAEIVAIVNSRPLLYVEDDTASIQVTPADLLGKTRTSKLPTFDEAEPTPRGAENTVEKVVTSWKRLQAMTITFWNHWRQGYLTSLREKHANATQRNPSALLPTIGSVVQIKDKVPRAQWRLGKIVQLQPSADGKIRSVLLRLANGRIIVRPLKILYPLEMQLENPPDVENQPNQPTPYSAAAPSSLEVESDADFEGFSSDEVEKVSDMIKNYDDFEALLQNPEKTKQNDPKSRPKRKAAIKASKALRRPQKKPAATCSWWESSDGASE